MALKKRQSAIKVRPFKVSERLHPERRELRIIKAGKLRFKRYVRVPRLPPANPLRVKVPTSDVAYVREFGKASRFSIPLSKKDVKRESNHQKLIKSTKLLSSFTPRQRHLMLIARINRYKRLALKKKQVERKKFGATQLSEKTVKRINEKRGIREIIRRKVIDCRERRKRALYWKIHAKLTKKLKPNFKKKFIKKALAKRARQEQLKEKLGHLKTMRIELPAPGTKGEPKIIGAGKSTGKKKKEKKSTKGKKYTKLTSQETKEFNKAFRRLVNRKTLQKYEELVGIRRPSKGRMFVYAVFTGYKRALRNQYEDWALLKIDGCTKKRHAKFYVGKRCAYVWKPKTQGKVYRRIEKVKEQKNLKRPLKSTKLKINFGKIVDVHGNSGMVRATFSRNLPPQAMGHRVRVYLYPSKI